MFLIEPCCTQRHWPALRSRLGDDGTAFFHGYGDLSLADLLAVMLTPYSNVELMIVAPVLPDAAARTLQYWLGRQLPRMDGKGRVDILAGLTLVTDLREKKSPMASEWLAENPFGDRLVLRSVQQNDTAVILPDVAIHGNINLGYGGHFTAIATKNARTIESLRSMYGSLK